MAASVRCLSVVPATKANTLELPKKVRTAKHGLRMMHQFLKTSILELKSEETMINEGGKLKFFAFSVIQVIGFVEESAGLCNPKDIHVCDGSDREHHKLMELMERQGMANPLPKYENW